MSHGLDLAKASTVIWAGPVSSNETYVQACDRVVGPKQTKETTMIQIVATEIERRIFSRLRSKQKIQGLLLDLIQQQQQE
jgi:SNF2 family DNA or RNA helicase